MKLAALALVIMAAIPQVAAAQEAAEAYHTHFRLFGFKFRAA